MSEQDRILIEYFNTVRKITFVTHKEHRYFRPILIDCFAKIILLLHDLEIPERHNSELVTVLKSQIDNYKNN